MKAYLLSALLLAPGTALAGWEYVTPDSTTPLTRAELNQYDLSLPADGAPAGSLPEGAANTDYSSGAADRPHLRIRYTPRRKTLLDKSGQRYLSPMLFGSGFLDSEKPQP